MKTKILLLATMLCSLLLSSCSEIERSAYPFIDGVALTWDMDRVNSYKTLLNDSLSQSDSLKKDSTFNLMTLQRSNVRLNSVIEKPKVAFQEKHDKWINSMKGIRLNMWLFRLMVIVGVCGFVIPGLVMRIRARYGKMDNDWIDYFYIGTFLLLTVLEAVLLFVFNYRLILLSPSVTGFWHWLLAAVGLLFVVFTHVMTGYLSADIMATSNDYEYGWWTFPYKTCIFLSLIGMLLYKYVGFYIQMAALIVGLSAFIIGWIRNKKNKSIAAYMYLFTVLVFPWVFVYFMSYTLKLILVVMLIVIGVVFGLKFLGVGITESYHTSNINSMYESNKARYHNDKKEAEREYYSKLEKENKQQ